MVSQETFERVQARQIARQRAREAKALREQRIKDEILMWVLCIIGGLLLGWCAAG